MEDKGRAITIGVCMLLVILSMVCFVGYFSGSSYPDITAIGLKTYAVEVNGSTFTYFSSREELTVFILEDKTNEIPYSKEFDCEDFAITLQMNAMKKGRIMNVVAIAPKQYNTLFGERLAEYDQHVINATMCGDGKRAEYVVIDPQTDEIRRIGFLGQ